MIAAERGCCPSSEGEYDSLTTGQVLSWSTVSRFARMLKNRNQSVTIEGIKEKLRLNTVRDKQ